MKKFLLIFLAILLCAGGFWAGKSYLDYKKFDFSMQSMAGNANLATFRGENLIIYFGYTFCPDVCPTTLALLNDILKKNNLEADYKVLFISLDPERDEIKATDEYVKYFIPNSAALIPTLDELERVTKNYGVKFEKIEQKDSKMGYSVGHSGVLYVFDKRGKFRAEISNPLRKEIEKVLLKNR